MELSERTKEEIYKLIELFPIAELKIKRIEQLEGRLAIPSVNELRYAGHHILKALNKPSEEEQLEELQKSIKHCKRANYDAVEIGIIHFLENFKLFQKDYNKIRIASVIPDYIDLCLKADKAQKLINNVDPASRHKHYEDCFKHFDSLEEILRILAAAREELNKGIDEYNKGVKKNSQQTTRWGVSILVTLITLGCMVYFHYSKNSSANSIELNSAQVSENNPANDSTKTEPASR